MTSPDTPAPRNYIMQAAFWMTGAIGSFSLMAVAGREISFELDTFEIMMYRSFVGVFIMLACLTALGKWHQVEIAHTRLHLVRNACHFAGQNLWFYALTVIPLAQVFALEFTSPLWVLVLSPLILGERLTRVRALAATLGFIGILIVARPSPETINAGTLAAATSAIGFAGTMMFTKKLTRRTTLASILLYLTVTQSLFGVAFAGFDGDIALPSADSVPWLVAIGICGLLAHFCITSALAIAPATVVVPIDFTRLPVIAVIGALFYQEPIDALVILGALVIFGANYLNIWSETRNSR